MKKFGRLKTGLTFLEMMMAMTVSLIVLMVVAMLSYSGQKSWSQAYNKNNSDLQVGTFEAAAAFGAFGRKANKKEYRLYKFESGKYLRILPENYPEEVVTGDAVEFRYWNTDLEPEIMTVTKTATAYVLFYFDNGDLKTDYGPFPPGGVDEAGDRITGADVFTRTLIRNVTSVEFSHTTQTMAGDGKGCVRMRVTATDPTTGNPKVLLVATLMRNTWP